MSNEPLRVQHGDRKPWDSDFQQLEEKRDDAIAAVLKDFNRLQNDHATMAEKINKIEKWMWAHQGMFFVVGAIGWAIFQKVFGL